jgi:hypothetical protein
MENNYKRCEGHYTRGRKKHRQCELSATFGSRFCGNHEPKRLLWADGRGFDTIFKLKDDTNVSNK